MRLRTLTVLLLGATFACGPQVRPPAVPGPQAGSACLNGAKDTLNGWLDGTVGTEPVRALFDCAGKSLTQFKERLKGSKPGQTSAEELRKFMTTYFIRDIEISDGLLNQAMEVKRAWVGGDSVNLTNGELEQLIRLMEVFKTQFLALAPYMPLTPNRVVQMDTPQLDAAVAQLKESAKIIGQALGERAVPYRFANLTALIDELEALPGREADTSFLPLLRERLPLLRIAKSLLISPGDQEFGGAAWRSNLKDIAEWYGLYLTAKHFKRQYSTWDTGEGFDRLVSLAETTFDYWLRSTRNQPDDQWAFRDIERLLDQLPKDTLPVKARSLAQTIRALTQRMLRQGPSADGVGVTSILKLRTAFRDWAMEQRHLGVVFANRMTRTVSREEILKAPRPKPTSAREREVIATFEAGLKDARKRALFAPGSNEVSFEWAPGSEQQSFTNLSYLNWMDKVSGLMVSGYGKKAKPTDPDSSLGVDIRQFVQFFADIREVGIQLKLFDPRDFTTPFKRFREGNLFMYGGNGDDAIDRTESTQVLAYMVSAKNLGNRVHDRMMILCENGPADIYDMITVDAECYRREYFTRWSQFFGRMPRLLTFYDGMSSRDRGEFIKYYEQAGRKVGRSNLMMGSPDEDGYGMLPLYIETTMARYDLNGDQQIDPKEAEVAFPTFRVSLETLYRNLNPGKGVPGETIMFGLFTYLLEYGKQPTTYELGKWLLGLGTWDFRIDRYKVVKILAFLSESDRERRTQMESEFADWKVVDLMERELQITTGDPSASVIKD